MVEKEPSFVALVGDQAVALQLWFCTGSNKGKKNWQGVKSAPPSKNLGNGEVQSEVWDLQVVSVSSELVVAVGELLWENNTGKIQSTGDYCKRSQ